MDTGISFFPLIGDASKEQWHPYETHFVGIFLVQVLLLKSLAS